MRKLRGAGILSGKSWARETVDPCLDRVKGCLKSPGWQRIDSGLTRTGDSLADKDTQRCLGGEGEQTSLILGNQQSSLTYEMAGIWV